MLRATLSHVVFPCGDAAATKLLPASLSLCQVRGRRRTLTPPPWVPPVHEKNKTDLIDSANRDLLRRVHEAERAAAVAAAAPAEAEVQAEMGSMCRRVGLMVTKIGMVPQWTNTGERMLCTLLHVEQNNVVSVTSPDEWYRRSLVGKRKAFNREGPLWKVTVGARDSDPARHPAAYRAQFARAGVQVKKQLGSFLVTEDAVPPVGIHLDARHFQVGQFVTASGRSIDWGFQGGMHRWGFRGQPTRRTTKSHRRIGSVGSVGDARIWPGKRMPGHMGHEWVTVSGLQVIRMNVDKQVIYVKGSVPGDIGETLLLKDCMQMAKQPKQIAIPTWTPSLPAIEEEAEEQEQEESPLGKSTEQFVPKLFRFSSPSIVFTADDEKRGVAKDRTKAKIAKVKK